MANIILSNFEVLSSRHVNGEVLLKSFMPNRGCVKLDMVFVGSKTDKYSVGFIDRLL